LQFLIEFDRKISFKNSKIRLIIILNIFRFPSTSLPRSENYPKLNNKNAYTPILKKKTVS